MDDALALMNGLYGTAVRLTRDGDAARDLVQDTYLKAIRAQSRFQPGTNLKAWLYTILHNTWRNRRRDFARARVSFDSDAVDAAVDTGHAGVVEHATPESALLRSAAIVCCTHSGHTSLRAARERPEAPILSLTPQIGTARRLALAWGVHSLHVPDVKSVEEISALAGAVARREGFAKAGETFVAIAGMPFGTPGTTNLMRIGIA